MRSTALITTSLFLALAAAQNLAYPDPAAEILDNPVGTSYKATFDSEAVKGALTFTAGYGGKGVDITVKLEGFEGESGPFGYHVHVDPVPADGNCTGTKAHLDPYRRGMETPCDSSKPATCEVGDLSGKHGKIPNGAGASVTFDVAYNDLYASTKEGIGAFLGNRSIVIHRSDTSRLACANITLVKDSYSPAPSSTATPTSGYGGNSTNGTSPPSPASPSNNPVYTGSAVASYGVSAVLVAAGVMAGLVAAL